ncbi:MAG: dephospho-CoA kinase [Acidimicrobiales bacterium]
MTEQSRRAGDMIAFGLTGGIGSGKSTVARLLAERGAVILDADQMARQVLEPGTEGLSQVIARFGQAYLLPDGALDRAGLAALVFNDPPALADLNAIVHPAVGRLMAARMSEHAGTEHILVLDVPLLFEGDGPSRYQLAGVLVVDAPVETAVRRLASSRAMTRYDVENRLAAQVSRAERVARADYLILNVGSLEELALMVHKAWDWMLGVAEAARGAPSPRRPD